MQTCRRGIGVFHTLLFDEGAIATLPKPETKGRDPELIAKRDELLLFRFYYKSKVQRKIYDDVLTELEGEVFLSKVMLQKIIQSKAETALLIKKEYSSLAPLSIRREFQKKFPFVVWD